MLKKTAFIILTLVICLLLLEGGLWAFHFVKMAIIAKRPVATQAAYKGESWVPDYAKEIQRFPRSDFRAFIHWNNLEFHGKYINTYPDGIRKTWHPDNAPEKGAKTVFCFGGSTLFGSGSRDDHTIPSQLSKMLNRDNYSWEIVNYGVPAYTLSQEVVYFTQLLKNGKAPDYVIFYDGVNEVFSSYVNGEAGTVLNITQFRKLLKQSVTPSVGYLLKRLFIMTMLYRAWNKFENGILKIPVDEEGMGPAAIGMTDAELERLSEQIVSEYVKNVEFVDRLSKAYGFKYVFFWQPAPFTAPPESLTADEKNSVPWHLTEEVKLFKSAYGRMENMKIKNFHNISRVLDGKDRAMYISFCHITEHGNKIVADEMYKIFAVEGEWGQAGNLE